MRLSLSQNLYKSDKVGVHRATLCLHRPTVTPDIKLHNQVFIGHACFKKLGFL